MMYIIKSGEFYLTEYKNDRAGFSVLDSVRPRPLIFGINDAINISMKVKGTVYKLEEKIVGGIIRYEENPKGDFSIFRRKN